MTGTFKYIEFVRNAAVHSDINNKNAGINKFLENYDDFKRLFGDALKVFEMIK